MPPLRITRPTDDGFTIVELLVAIVTVVVGLAAIGASLLAASEQREQAGLRLLILDRVQSLMEEIKGRDPGDLVTTYDGAAFPVAEVAGESSDEVITVDVDDSDPSLIAVTLTAAWRVRDHTETLSFRTEIFDENGL